MANSKGVYSTFEELCSELKRCSDCCSGDYLSIHCPLCPVWKYKPRQLSKVRKHLTVHWQTGVQGHNGKYMAFMQLRKRLIRQNTGTYSTNKV